MKVWVVTQCWIDWDTDAENVLGVYSSKDIAKKAVKEFKKIAKDSLTVSYFINEFEIDRKVKL